MNRRTLENNIEHGAADAIGPAAVSTHAGPSVTQLSVAILEGVAGLEKMAAKIDALNAASERPNPFLSGSFLVSYARHCEYVSARIVERLFLFYENSRLVGCFPMLVQKATLQADGGFIKHAFRSMVFLGYIDTEQPTIIAAPQDQARCATALIDYLSRHGDWDLVHLTGQLPDSPLYRAAHAASGWKLRVRDIAVAPYNEIPISWNDLDSYFRSLSQKMRSNIGRQSRKLYAAGEVQLVYAEGAAGASAWFDAYCDLDSRSWKDATPGSIRRHPGRIEFYRDISSGNAGFEPSFIGILLDGVLVAGLILGSNLLTAPHRHGIWCLEMAYDRSYSKLGPGQLLFLLAMGQAITERHRHLNFMQNFDYYKHRWGATTIKVTDVQIMRRFSIRHLLALLGEMRRRQQQRKLAAASSNADPATTEEAGTGDTEVQQAVSPQQLQRARELTQRALATGGGGVRVLDRAAARSLLPFDIG